MTNQPNQQPTEQPSREAVEAASKLARHIFSLGDEPNSSCNRIQFKGGKWPDNEQSQGGMCESALTKNLIPTLSLVIDAATAELKLEVERVKQDRNRIGVEIRGEWQKKCAAIAQDRDSLRHQVETVRDLLESLQSVESSHHLATCQAIINHYRTRASEVLQRLGGKAE